MQTFAQSLIELVLDGRVDREVAAERGDATATTSSSRSSRTRSAAPTS